MRLNGWQRIGLVTSIVWFIAGGLWGNKIALDEAGARTSLQLDACVAENKRRHGEYGPHEQVWTPCWDQFGANFMRNAEGHWMFAALFALVPLPIAWLLAYALVRLVRWIRAGFKPSA
jgi:hypothetical protein